MIFLYEAFSTSRGGWMLRTKQCHVDVSAWVTFVSKLATTQVNLATAVFFPFEAFLTPLSVGKYFHIIAEMCFVFTP